MSYALRAPVSQTLAAPLQLHTSEQRLRALCRVLLLATVNVEMLLEGWTQSVEGRETLSTASSHFSSLCSVWGALGPELTMYNSHDTIGAVTACAEVCTAVGAVSLWVTSHRLRPR